MTIDEQGLPVFQGVFCGFNLEGCVLHFRNDSGQWIFSDGMAEDQTIYILSAQQIAYKTGNEYIVLFK